MKSSVLPVLLIFIFVISGCTYSGRNDIALYLEKFNSVSGDSLQAETENLLIHPDEKTKEKTYYMFFPSGGDGEYMISLNEDPDGDIYKLGICIISNIDPEPEVVEKIFTSGLYALKNINTDAGEKLFKELKLNDKDTYQKASNLKEETDEYTLELIVNEAGTGIYIY